MKSMFLVCLVFAGVGVGALVASMVGTSKSSAQPGLDPVLTRSLDAIESQLAEMKQRIVALEQHPAVVERVDVAKPPHADGSSVASDAAAAAKPLDPAAAKEAEVAAATKELAPKFAKLALDGVPPADLHKLLAEIAKNGQQDAAVAAAKALVDKNACDSKAHYLLGEAYYAKLSTSGSIAAYQTLGPLTLGEWEKASELDPKYWDPKFEHATYLTFVPESLGMTPQVITEFESLIEMQNGSTSNPTYARSYEQLSRMYLRVGKKEKALQIVRDGSALFPDDTSLQKQRDLLEKN